MSSRPRLGSDGGVSRPAHRAVVIAAVLALGLGACGGDDAEPEARPSSTTSSTVEERDQDVFAFDVGDCFNDPEGVDLEAEGADLTSVGAVPCNEPHDNEVIHLFEVEDADEFPGTDALTERAEECVGPFEDYVGISYDESELEIFPFVPSAESWEQGDREIVCAVYLPDEQKLTGTVRDAER